MTPNRRNHYRILHVQPEAPAEVIKASYRTMMTRMRMHPDLGGRHEDAALINEAYAVLSDPARRAEYDRQLRLHSRPELMRQGAAQPSAAAPAAAPSSGPCTVRPGGRLVCAFCAADNPASAAHPPLCGHCGAPLSPVRVLAMPNFRGSGGLNRRGSVRRNRDHEAVAYWGHPVQRHRVRWRDLSASGLSVWSVSALAIGERLHLMDQDLQVVAEVVGCEARGGFWLLRAQLLTMRPVKRSGLFYSAEA